MKKSIAMKWIKALESGEYKKANGKLCIEGKKSDSFCCLGVLTELYIQEHNKKNRDKIGWEDSFGELAFDGEPEILPRRVQDWAGIYTSSGDFDLEELPREIKDSNNIENSNLTGINDNTTNFKAVTAVIKAVWKSL